MPTGLHHSIPTADMRTKRCQSGEWSERKAIQSELFVSMALAGVGAAAAFYDVKAAGG